MRCDDGGWRHSAGMRKTRAPIKTMPPVEELRRLNEVLDQRVRERTEAIEMLHDIATVANQAQDLKQAIDKNSGMKFAEMAGKMWDEAGLQVAELVKNKGNSISSISEDEKARWVKTTEPVIDGWVKQVKDKGLDGAKLLEQARALIAKYDKA